GQCEQAVGHAEAAMAAWARVPSRSAFAVPAALRRAELAMRRGRWLDAEALLRRTLDDPRGQAVAIRRPLFALLWMQGRGVEAAALIQDNWRQMSRPDWPRPDEATEAMEDLLAMRVDAPTVEGIRAVLAMSARQAPDDDRVRLGRANLATRTGQFDEAEAWL